MQKSGGLREQGKLAFDIAGTDGLERRCSGWPRTMSGRFGEVPWPTLRQAIDIQVTPPQIEVRDPEKETRVRQILNSAGILSRHTWAAQESLDYEQEQKIFREEAAAQGSTGHASQKVPSNAERHESETV